LHITARRTHAPEDEHGSRREGDRGNEGGHTDVAGDEESLELLLAAGRVLREHGLGGELADATEEHEAILALNGLVLWM